MLQDLITAHKPGLSGHTELRAQRSMDRAVTIVAGNIVTNQSSEVQGVCARVYDGGYWGFASSGEYDDRAIGEVLSAASRNAGFLTSRLGSKAAPLPSLKGSRLSTSVTEFKDAEQGYIIDFARALDAYITGKYPGLASRRVFASTSCIEKLLVTSDGADVFSLIPRSFAGISLSVEASDGSIAAIPDNLGGGHVFFAEYYRDPMALYEQIDTLYEQVMKKSEGIHANAGVREVILDSRLAGILAHEAIGHTTEADLVLGGSVAGPYLNKQVASELVTLVDFANTALGSGCPQPIFVDDEGTIARDVTIIENGILKEYMHNRETAQRFGHEPTGNARANAFSDEPLVRMRNTAILPGGDKLQDMIASIDDGYYLTHTGNGQADLTSEFMFSVNMGYEIKNGRLGRAIRDTTISGVAFDLLKTVSMISDEMTWSSSGMCGKKQQIAVGMGGPSVKCRVNIGGR